ncbi:MAG TPA: hypothetical protein VFD48_17615 [Pyrinomonadaceae bacterium]|nr:hypothetical protein [Pyrinomonadaceae bacterium]
MAYVKIGVMVALLILVLSTDLSAKSWRGITPLKSTRTDVESLFGKPNELGRYEIENDRAYIFFSAGQCAGKYQNLGREKCECLVPRDTVLRIAVTLENRVKFQGINRRKFTRVALDSSVPMSTYSDDDDGIVYTVLDSEETITAIDYWPSTADCKDVVEMHADSAKRNVWRGIRPLHSTRADVEKILGQPKRQSLDQTYAYETTEEQIDVLYSEGPCSSSVVGQWNVPADTVLRVTIYPLTNILIPNLRLDRNKYSRGPAPHIPNWFFWVNRDEGVIIQLP